MHMGGAESKAVVKKGGVDNGPALRPLQEVTQVAQVSVTTPHAVPGAVLIQDKHLAWAEPTLHTITQAQRREQCRRLPAEVPAGPAPTHQAAEGVVEPVVQREPLHHLKKRGVVKATGVSGDKFIHAMFLSSVSV